MMNSVVPLSDLYYGNRIGEFSPGASAVSIVVTAKYSLGDMVSGSRKLVDSGNERFPRRY